MSNLEDLHAALLEFASCVGTALGDICSYGLTMGDSYVPFNPDPDEDCSEDDALCSQVWVRVTQVDETVGRPNWDGSSCTAQLTLGLEVGVLRCFNIPEDGEAPTATDVTTYALTAMSDMHALRCAALDCEVWDSIDVGTWLPVGPMGGQHGGTWTFTVTLP